MNNLVAAYAAITLYLSCTVLLLMRIRQYRPVTGLNRSYLLLPGLLAIVLHALALYGSMVSPIGINLGFYNALSLVAAFITLFTLLAILRYQIEIMGIITMSATIVILLFDMTNTSSHLLAPGSSGGLIVHVLVSLIAYSVLALAALYALILSVQNSFLHSHNPGGIIRLLPPLKTMESLLFETILIGFIGLCVSLLSGLVFLDDMFAQRLVHKTILSILAWVVFAILLIGHWFLGWRGRTAIRWTLGGFLSLMLAYFGTKFVIEVLLV